MFDMLHSLPAMRTVAAVHEVFTIVRHFKALPPDEREHVARRKAAIAKYTETDTALAVITEIEQREGRPLADLDDITVERYLRELGDFAMGRLRQQYPPDPERANRLLEQMRRASGF